jgi:hypothetical protein
MKLQKLASVVVNLGELHGIPPLFVVAGAPEHERNEKRVISVPPPLRLPQHPPRRVKVVATPSA